MTRLKTDTLLHHISYIKTDLKRIILLVLVPALSIIYNPTVFFLIFSTLVIPSKILWLILPTIICFVVSLYVQIFSKQKPDYQPDLKASFVFTLYLVLLNAFAEELFFRGLLLNVLLLVFKYPLIAITLSAAVFGYYHIPLFRWHPKKAFLAFLGGLLFGIVYHYSNSLIAAWAAHAAADLGLVHEGLVGYFVWTRLRHKEIK